jgi:hypothetical protein
MVESGPMAKELDAELHLLNNAIRARDLKTWTKWTAEFEAWVSSDCSGRCPFKTLEILKCMFFTC